MNRELDLYPRSARAARRGLRVRALDARRFGAAALLALAVGIAGPAAAEAGEGIKVHGDWTITIHNPDGSLDREVKFSNALVDTDTLSNLVLGAWTAVDQTIGIAGSWDPNACDPGQLNDTSATRVAGQNAVQLSKTYSLGAECVLESGWTITDVSTRISSIVTGSTNGDILGGPFTRKTLEVPVSGILPDQQVTVKVVISFS